MLCFLRQFKGSIIRSDYLALRLGFVIYHKLPHSYDFHKYMVRSMEDYYNGTIGISWPLWAYAIVCVLINVHVITNRIAAARAARRAAPTVSLPRLASRRAMASTKAPGPGEKHHSIDTQLHQLVPGKVSEDDKLIEYDALLIDHFLNILQDLHRPSLREFVQECYEVLADYEGKGDTTKLGELSAKLMGLAPVDAILVASSILHMLNLANLAEEVQITHRRRNSKLKKGGFADEGSATTESDIEETLKRLVSEVEQSIRGIHGPNRQFAAINFLETLVSEFSPSTASAMSLPKEFHEQCEYSLEVQFLKDFYCWAQAAVFNTADKILNSTVTIPDERACSAALRLMFQILSWNFKHTVEHESSDAKINFGLRIDTINLKKFERSMWREILISSGHPTWVLNFYTTLRQKYSYDTLWGDSPIAVSCRQLIVQLCSLAGSVFPNDNGDAQIKHLMLILSAVVQWIEPPDVITASIRNGGSESEFIDGCHALLSIASLTTGSLFDNLLKSIRPYGTVNLLSALTSEAVKSVLNNQSEEETWGIDSLDILLETWNVLLGIPEALQAGFPNVIEAAHHPVVTLSCAKTLTCCFLGQFQLWSIINFSRQCLDPGIRAKYFSPRLMEAVIWFLARWVATYLVPLDVSRGKVSREIDNVGTNGSQHSRKLLNSFAWENNQGELVLDFVVLISMLALTTYQGENELQDSWRDLTRAFASGRSLLSLSGRLQRSLAETLASGASCIKDPEASAQYLRDLMGPVAGCLVENASRSDLKSVAQQADVIYMSTVVYMILKFVVDFVDGQAVFLDAKETSALVSFCLQLLQIYSSHNIGKVGFLSDCGGEGSPDIAEVIYIGLDIVTPLISLDLLKYPKLSRDYFVLISHLLELYPEKVAHLNSDAFTRIIGSLDFGLRNQACALPLSAFTLFILCHKLFFWLAPVSLGINMQDSDVVERCLAAVNALASYNFKERLGGRGRLNSQLMESEGSNGKLQESISSHFLRLLLQILLFEDFRSELAGYAADALLPLLFCEQELYQRLVHELLDKQQNPTVKSRLATAFHNLTSSNNLSSSLDRPNRQRFRKNLLSFMADVSGFMQIK
ncbi:Phosphoenolpyruvate carboxylase 1 [Zea mays]|uniref:Exportin-4 n=1 Tax=Zea mays TaxID=4577 RepID=A0A317Y0B0_MAIZE|nr:Phosphoenolpyruvate carboxylase 1 [Zea mays]